MNVALGLRTIVVATMLMVLAVLAGAAGTIGMHDGDSNA